MTATIQVLLLFLAVLAIAAVIARWLNTAPSIVLVIAGVALALTPGLPAIELARGIGVGWLSLRLRRLAREPRVEIVLSLMTPYLAYWVPEHLGGSGVLATVATGLYVSWNGPLLIPSATRLQGIFFWDLIIYLIEGFVFLLTGLQARSLFERMQNFSLRDIVIATAVTTAVVIVARFLWMYPATYLPRLVNK